MSKNSRYTYNYFQPEDYHFSLDSIFLAQQVAELIKNSTHLNQKVLDLCAGCGIIGLELSIYSSLNLNIDFLEVQEIYRPYFLKNLEMIYADSPNKLKNFNFINLNYQALLEPQFNNFYDLIVSNPPYFFIGEGLLSPNEFKNRCRFFIDSNFKTLIESIIHSLKINGNAYLLVRSGKNHGRKPIYEIQKTLGDLGSANIIDNVRGTDIIKIIKNDK